jgi:hypothetical protein
VCCIDNLIFLGSGAELRSKGCAKLSGREVFFVVVAAVVAAVDD